MIDYIKMPSIKRLSRECWITEKIDGTNGCIYVGENGEVLAGSKNRWITPENDNFDFAKWVKKHEDVLRLLPPGFHRGEYWGSGINRGYGLEKGEKRFSLFNQKLKEKLDKSIEWPFSFVPVLFVGMFCDASIEYSMECLKNGSYASLGYMKPEGIVIYHTAANVMFKKTFENDEGKNRKI